MINVTIAIIIVIIGSIDYVMFIYKKTYISKVCFELTPVNRI